MALSAFFHQFVPPCAYTLAAQSCSSNTHIVDDNGTELHLVLVFSSSASWPRWLQWLFLGDTEIFKRIIDGTFDSAKRA